MTVSPEPGGAEWFSVGGMTIPLPSYARPDLATTITTALTPFGGSFSVVVTADDRHMRVIVAAYAKFNTSATVANRTPFAAYIDPNNRVVAEIPTSADIAASATVNLTFQLSLTAAFGSAASALVAPLSPIVLYPGWTFEVGVNNLQAGDTWSNAYVVESLIPTGPPPARAPAVATAMLA